MSTRFLRRLRSCPPSTPRSLGYGVRMRLVGNPPRGHPGTATRAERRYGGISSASASSCPNGMDCTRRRESLNWIRDVECLEFPMSSLADAVALVKRLGS